jgi:hypothetical protein
VLQNRLLDLTLSGDEVFACERGIDLGEFFSIEDARRKLEA